MKTKVLILLGILIIAFAAMVAPVMAADATITGNPTAVIDVSVPTGSQSIGLTLEPGQAAVSDPANPEITVSSNEVGWTVTATDTTPSTTVKGHMSKYDTAYDFTKYLTNAMTIAHTSIPLVTTGGSSDLSSSSNTIATGLATVDEQSVPFTITQTVLYTDPVLSSANYQMIVTFTGSVS
jgi:hypothetical protein